MEFPDGGPKVSNVPSSRAADPRIANFQLPKECIPAALEAGAEISRAVNGMDTANVKNDPRRAADELQTKTQGGLRKLAACVFGRSI